MLALGLHDGWTEIVEVKSGTRAARLPGGHGIVYALAFDPAGTRLAIGTEGGSVSLWETHSWTRLLDLEPHVLTAAEPTYRYVFDLAFHPEGAQLVSASGDHTLRVWPASPVAVAAR
jgi:WD40 repeat protein